MDSPAPLAALAARLVGLWHAVPDRDGGIVTYMRFLEDLRYVGVFNGYVKVADEPMKLRWQWMRVWMVLEPNSILLCSGKRGGSTWTRTFYFEGECLIIDVTTCQIEAEPAVKRKLYRCHRIAVQDLPEGAEEEFNKAMARPWL
jgi:hypothetical protein